MLLLCLYLWLLLIAVMTAATMNLHQTSLNDADLDLDLDSTQWDYIVVGTGPAGLVLADRLSEAGKKVLVLEAGVESTYATGGREAPDWIKNSKKQLSRFDIPGFFQAFGAHPAGHQCPDIPVQAACVLGGGAAINSGIYFLPPSIDWTTNFPSSWPATALESALEKARSRIPGTTNPSQDGIAYFPQAFDIWSNILARAGWKEVSANNPGEIEEKKNTYAKTPFMNIDGTRGGPLGTYAITAMVRKNCRFIFRARVQRVLRKDGCVTGIEFTQNGHTRTIPVAKHTRVVLSAGALGSPKILWQSGIGPSDVLATAKAALGARMVGEDEWIDLPVGYNLVDHTATYLISKYKDAQKGWYDYLSAWDNPRDEDAKKYLEQKAGPLASSNARISAWTTTDGRVTQYNGRIGTATGVQGKDLILMTAYLTLGTTSRGRLALTPETLNITIQEPPYLRTEADIAAVVKSVQTLVEANKKAKARRDGSEVQWVFPSEEDTEDVEKWVRAYPSWVDRGSNHWVGTTWMEGGSGDGKGVVDRECKVKGTENLYVVDAGVFPGLPTSNLVGAIIVLAERAVEVWLAEKEEGLTEL